MKLINMVCPNCGAALQADADKNKLTCSYCGNSLLVDDEVQHIQYDNAEDAGYQFEKGRQRAQAEQRMNNISTSTVTYQPSKPNYTWLWVVGWICCFPIPITVLVARSKSLTVKGKTIIIAVMWTVILIVGIIGNIVKPDDETDRHSHYSDTGSSYESLLTSSDEE